jgi:WD40 repeat protein
LTARLFICSENYYGVKNMKRLAALTVCLLLFLVVPQLLMAQRPELVVQTGNTNNVESVAFSPDGKTLAAGSGNFIKLWDVSTGTDLRTLKGHSNLVRSVAFSPDGKILASSSSDRTVKLWNISTGTELRTLIGHSEDVFSIAFNPTGRILVSGDDDGKIKLWDIATGKELRTLEVEGAASSVAFSPDGTTVAGADSDGIVKLWRVATGTELRTLRWTAAILSVAFSPDGKTLASGSSDEMVELWDASTGTELRTLKMDGYVNSAIFSPDGRTIAAGSSFGIVKVWDVATGTDLRTLKGHRFSVQSVAFSPDGKTLASGSWDKNIKLWDVSTGSNIRTLEAHSQWVESVVFSPDGRTIATGGADETIKLWNVSTGMELRSLRGHSDRIKSLAFSPDGKMLASESFDKTIKLWDVPTGKELRTLKVEVYDLSVAFSPDGKTLASSNRATVKLWDVSTGTELRTLKIDGFVTSVVFSPDGRTIAAGSYFGFIKLWEVSTGAELLTLKAHTKRVRSIAFSPNGKTLASSGDAIELWDVSTGTLKGNLADSGSVAFSSDGRMLVSFGGSTIKLWDISTATLFRIFRGHSDYVSSVVFSPNNQYLISGSWDASVKVWEVGSGKELASLIAVDQRDWIVVTPDGLFDGSPAAWNKIIWRFNNNTFNYAPVEAFFSDFYYPGLLADIFADKRPTAPSDISQKDRRQPQLKLTLPESQSGSTLTTRNVTVKIDVSQSPAGAQDVRLFRNGSLVKVWHGDVLKGQNSATLETTIPIVAGENRLTAYAFNHDNIKSSDATLTVNGADSLKRPGTAYVLAVGVNTYSNANYNLKYAVADAEDFSAEFKRQQETLKKYERVEVIPLYDKDATKANILQALEQLATKAQPEDAVIVYFSGHGTAQQQRFYLIPSDLGYQGERTKLSAADLQTILSHSISDRELEAAFEKIDAGQFLTVIDACNSGQALDAEEKRRGPMNSKGLAQLAYEKGMYILTAAQSYQAALEASRIGHGYLTYALVEEGLKQGKADREPKDNQIVMREWLDYATERVPQMQEEKMKETPQVKDQQGRELELVFVEGDERITDPEKRSVQRPRVFYRRETESLPLIVARPQTTPAKN